MLRGDTIVKDVILAPILSLLTSESVRNAIISLKYSNDNDKPSGVDELEELTKTLSAINIRFCIVVHLKFIR